MLLAKLFVMLCMLLGLTGTFIHRIPGTPLIFFAAVIYSIVMGLLAVVRTWIVILFALMLSAEVVSRYMRNRLRTDAGMNKVFGLDICVGTLTSLVLARVLAGPVLGGTLWLLLIGKSLIPILKPSSVVVFKLLAAALFRLMIAVAMIIIVSFKVL